MFVDIAKVIAKAGDGGNGVVSLHHARGLPMGGPDGGDGGHGGSVVFIASNNENTLVNFRYQKELNAEDGRSGKGSKMHGRNGEDLIVKVPVGTQISVGSEIIADLTHNEMRFIAAKGGRGGFGNAHFTSSTRQTPKIAELGEPGETLELGLELKMIADVGLVGLPNAGKSTLLARISNARPEIANYAFTTLRPNLGVVKIEKGRELLFADIPGLIEGASEGKGLGDEFLRHVERTKVLIHLVDAYNDDVAVAYKTIVQELKAYKIDMSDKPQLVALNKIDGLDDDIIDDLKQQLLAVAHTDTVYAISAQSGTGVQQLLYAVSNVVTKQKELELAAEEAAPKIPVITAPVRSREDTWNIEKVANGIVIIGEKFERFALRTDFENEEAITRLRDILRKNGVMKKIEKMDLDEGSRIYFGSTDGSFLEY